MQAGQRTPSELVSSELLYEYGRALRALGQTEAAAQLFERAATLKLEEANARRKKIAVEVEALLTLKREQWQTHRRTAERKAQEQLDEFGLRRWQSASKKK